jgi:uncharacterized protein (DUF1778 family)
VKIRKYWQSVWKNRLKFVRQVRILGVNLRKKLNKSGLGHANKLADRTPKPYFIDAEVLDKVAVVLTTDTRSGKVCIVCVFALSLPRRTVMRNASINLRAHAEQRDLIDQAANLLGKNRSDFMLEAACEKAQGVMLDQVFFSLNTQSFQQFCDLLDAPPAPNPGLARLLSTKAPWDGVSKSR